LNDDIEFFLIQEVGNDKPLNEGADAILGHARPNNKIAIAPSKEVNQKMNLLEAISPEGQTFSTRFQNTYISWIDYGVPDAGQRAGTPAVIPAVPDFFWSGTSNGIRVFE
jgi:hypothetical protein